MNLNRGKYPSTNTYFQSDYYFFICFPSICNTSNKIINTEGHIFKQRYKAGRNSYGKISDNR